MRRRIVTRVRSLVFLFPELLARLGVIDRERGLDVFGLALPVMVTSGIWTLLRIVDFFMVSLALSDAAVAGLEFGFQYYFVGFSLAIALSSGTISLVSRFEGADDRTSANVVVKQSLWFALVIALPLTAITWVYAAPLIGLLARDPTVVRLGATYLRVVMLGLGFRFWTLIASRALAGSGDTLTPMYVNGVTIPLNVVLNAVLIFGAGPAPRLGIAGAAWGTVIANGLSAVGFLGIFLSGRFGVRLRVGGPQWDRTIARELLRVGSPLAGMRLLNTFGRFPFLFILASLGTPVVAAFAIGRRIMQLAMIPSWGYSTAASTLVGQRLGANEDREATDYGWEALSIALVTQIVIAVVVVLFAHPIAALSGTRTVALTVAFIRVFGLGIVAFATGSILSGALRGAGDTTWPLYGTVLGTGLRLGISALALPVGIVVLSVGPVAVAPGLGLGVVAVFAAILVDWHARALVNAVRFRSGRWRAVARESVMGARPESEPEVDD